MFNFLKVNTIQQNAEKEVSKEHKKIKYQSILVADKTFLEFKAIFIGKFFSQHESRHAYKYVFFLTFVI